MHAALLCLLLGTAAGDRFDVLFDGQTLDGWDGLERFWSVEDGAIVGRTTEDNPTNGNTFLIWRGGEVGDFEFRCKVRFQGVNSGVQYRSELANADKFVLKGYQADLHPKADYYGMLYGEKTGRGIIATRGQKVAFAADETKTVLGKVGDSAKIDSADWNDLTIVAAGNRLIHQVNGVTTVDVTDDHPVSFRRGKLGLQLHAGGPMAVEFRGLLLRELSAEAGAKRIAELTAARETAAATPADDSWIDAEPKAQWVWADTESKDQVVLFRKSFDLPAAPKSARLYATCDNRLKLHLNGKRLAESRAWQDPVELSVEGLKAGRNVLAVHGRNEGGVAAMVLKLHAEMPDGSTRTVVSDGSWVRSPDGVPGWTEPGFDDSAWAAVVAKGDLGKQPWGVPRVGGVAAAGPKTIPPRQMLTPPGFVVEKVYEVAGGQGSWVALCVDPKGRVYASDQGKAGLFRMTLREGEEPLIERVDAGDAKKLSGAQGLCWAFDSLWVHRNGGHLYRVTDTDGDDRLDKTEEFPGGTSGGEHGNHAVVPHPDGESLLLVGGNHATPAEFARKNVAAWNEGLLLPRMWDAKGHARGRTAPGGWIAKVDPQTGDQTLLTIGFRNQYDVAVNRFGDVLTYDADMEWDMGMPWYRPTRVCHAVSGADFGWRSGSGKWPAYYEDSVPPVVDIGPGSPTGMVSGVGTAFPTKYQDAVFACDWTFGTIYAVHLKPSGSSYTATPEPFVTGSPLPVTDGCVAADGSMLFAVGGRGTRSAVYRVRYVGNASIEPPTTIDADAAAARQTRRTLEAFHGVEDPAAVDAAWPHLSSKDRFLRNAARAAVEAQPVASWADRALAEEDPQAAVTAGVALARVGDASYRKQLLLRLYTLPFATMTEGQRLGLLRAYALMFLKLGEATEEERRDVAGRLAPLLPTGSPAVDTEILRLLVYLRDDSAVPRGMAMLADASPSEAPDWSGLIARNARYGGSIRKMLDDPPPTRKLLVAFLLRNVRDGWTLDQRRAYFRFLNDSATKSGGSSYAGFLTRIRDEALATLSDADRKALEDVTGESFDPEPDFAVHPIEGPGRKWTLDAALAATRGKPDFGRGRSLYVAAKCASCHRLGGLGGNIGPDLTSVRNKFDDRYLTEAIIHPSKDISDQYGSSVVILEDGRVLEGLLVEGGEEVTVYPSDPDAPPVVARKDAVLETEPSKVSQMPAGLLDPLSAEEVRDLLAYVLAAGDPEDKRYKK